MTETKVDFQSTLSESLGLEPRVVQLTSDQSNATRNGGATAPVTSRTQIVPLRFNAAALR